MKQSLFYLFSLILILSCTNEESCDQSYGASFSIEEGGRYCFPDGSLLTIDEISNSYCPCDVQCVWEGEGVASGIWTGTDGIATPTMIHETITNSNLPWLEVASVTKSSDCQPRIEEFRIIVFDPATRAPSCDQEAIVDMQKYDKEPSDEVHINSATIVDDCLTVNISASGCDGNSWTAQLYDSGAVAESEPEQRYIKLTFTNNEACLAVFNRDFNFDLSPLQIPNNGVLLLNFQNSGEQLRYEY